MHVHIGEDDFSIVLFKHQSWKEPVEFMYHCGTKWAILLMSLKSLMETGRYTLCSQLA